MNGSVNPTVYFDQDCRFCTNAVKTFKRCLLLTNVNLAPAQSNSKIYEKMLANDSWVVTDKQGNPHYKYEAFTVMCKSSPLVSWLVPFLSLPAMNTIGDRIYHYISSRRTSSCKNGGCA